MRIALLAVAGAVLLAGNATAATQSGNFQVTARVVKTCNIQSATTGIAFGDYDPAGANSATDVNNTGLIAVRCTKGTSMTVQLEEGQNGATGGCQAAPVRKMKNAAGDFLAYSISSDSGMSTNWGCGAASDPTRTAAKSNADETFVTYGKIQANQDVPAGNYSDVVRFNVVF